jgi:hypothetical protein
MSAGGIVCGGAVVLNTLFSGPGPGMDTDKCKDYAPVEAGIPYDVTRLPARAYRTTDELGNWGIVVVGHYKVPENSSPEEIERLIREYSNNELKNFIRRGTGKNLRGPLRGQERIIKMEKDNHDYYAEVLIWNWNTTRKGVRELEKFSSVLPFYDL